MNQHRTLNSNLFLCFLAALGIIFANISIYSYPFNSLCFAQILPLAESSKINNEKKNQFKIKPIENQRIEFGKSFIPVKLNDYIEPGINSSKISWKVSGNTNIIVDIDSQLVANFYSKDLNWYGKDTITFSALINDSISLSTKSVFAINPPPIYDRMPIKPVKKILIVGVNDVISLVTNPVRWDSTDFLKLPTIMVGTYLFMVGDQDLHKWISDDGRAKHNAVMDFGTIYGKSVTSQLAALGFGLYGLVFRNDEFLQIGLEIYESYFIANNITSILKRSFGRLRPYENKGPYNFSPFPDRSNPINSFPSGHSTLAFSLSSVLASHVQNPWLKVLIYAPAVITAVSRVYNNFHWFSDVFMGSAVGYFVGTFLVSRHNHILNNNLSIGISPSGMLGLQFNF